MIQFFFKDPSTIAYNDLLNKLCNEKRVYAMSYNAANMLQY